MSGSVKLENALLGYTADLTNLNCSVQYVYNNPLFIMPTPLGTPLGDAQLVVDFKLISVRYVLTFDLIDGSGTSSVFNSILNLTTIFGMVSTAAISFTWGARVIPVKIESFVAGTQAGKFDYMPGCTLTLVPFKTL